MELFMNLLPTSKPTGLFTSQRHRLNTKSRRLVPGVSPRSRFTSASFQANISFASKLTYDQKQRRSANYQPSYWDYEELLSQKNEYAGQFYMEKSNVLKEQVEMVLDEEMKPLCQLELIDNLQRLGISYHFQDKIGSILSRIYFESIRNIIPRDKGLYETALEFRLLRQHNFNVPQEVFDGFRCEKAEFKESLREETKGLLYLYEASFLLTENERTLELAREFTLQHLKKNMEEKRVDPELAVLVEHAIEVPLHWRMLRLEARWFIDVYGKRTGMNPTLLEFAKLDFNIVQATHRLDLQHALRWWNHTGIAERLPFARDRMVENFFWTVGIIFDPKYGYCRKMVARVDAMITTMDDIFDVYGTMDELELFTDAVERWDTKAISQLPDYMKICYLALHNFVSEMAYDVLKEQGAYIVPHLNKVWADLCRAYVQEAKWYSSGYTPTLQEYLDIAWISVGGPQMLVTTCFCISNPIKKEAIDLLDKYHNIIRCSSMILRLEDDLGTSSEEVKRGDVPKSIQCYMKETGATEEEARQHLRFLISEKFKEINKEVVMETRFSQPFMAAAMNLGRMAHCMYQTGDGHGHQNPTILGRISAMLFEPIHLAKM